MDKYSDYLNEEFKNTLGWSISEIVQVEDKEEIKKTNIAQPYIFAVSYCYGLEAIKKLGNPKVGIGHSLGEYTALVLGGYMSFKDALKVISVRGEAMQKAVERSNTSMAAVLTSDMSSTISSIQKLNEQGIEINISNYNDASQIVISGLIEDLDYLKSNPKDLDAKRVIPLDVAGAFHSPTVTPAKNALETVLNDIEINTGNFEVYLKWNDSFIYTVTAAHLAKRLGGAKKYKHNNPSDILDIEAMIKLQNVLRSKGYDVGKVDGILGAKTRQAVRSVQLEFGLSADSWPTKELLRKLLIN